MTKEANESLTNNVMSMHLLPKSIEAEKKETEFEKRKRIGAPKYSIEQLMKECDVEMQWNHVRHVPKCDNFSWLKPHGDKLEGTEEYGKKEEKKAPWSVKFEAKDDTRFKIVAEGKTHEGKVNNPDRKYFDELWKEVSLKGDVELYIDQNLHAKLAENHIDANTFWKLSESEFKDIVGIQSFGKRKRLMSRIEEIKEEHEKKMEEEYQKSKGVNREDVEKLLNIKKE